MRAAGGDFAEIEIEQRGTNIDVRSGGDQKLRDFGVIFGNGPHQCRLAAIFIGRIDVGAGGQQGFDSGDASGARGRHERSFAFAESGVDVGSGFDQRFDHGAIAAVARLRKAR